MTADSFKPVNCTVLVLRASIKEPMRTAFGTMKDRPVVLVGISDADGITGWGEIWCNFPSCGAEHRARLLVTEIAPLLLGRTIEHPAEYFTELTQALHLLVNQTGEEGPIAQVISGVDMALWDLYAQRAGVPLYQALAGHESRSSTVPVYASGLNPHLPEQKVREKLDQGYQAFKLKVGFDDKLDLRNAATIRKLLGPDMPLMVDANQGWDLPHASKMIEALAEFNPLWVEEPLPVDADKADWQALSRSSPVPLAGGENLRGFSAFEEAIDSGVFRFIQPDAAKWGGLSGSYLVARRALQAGLIYCPHWLGGGVGLLASSHLLCAVGGEGMLEVDANPNPLRDELFDHTSTENPQSTSGSSSRVSSHISGNASPQFWQPRPVPGLGISLCEATIKQYSQENGGFNVAL